jgi:hypothetical protein
MTEERLKKALDIKVRKEEIEKGLVTIENILSYINSNHSNPTNGLQHLVELRLTRQQKLSVISLVRAHLECNHRKASAAWEAV